MLKPHAVRTAAVDWIDRSSVGRFLHFLLLEMVLDDIPGLAAQMAYGFLFAVFPLLLFLATALGFVGDALGVDHLFDLLLRRVSPFLPAQAVGVVDRYLETLLTTRSPAFLTFGLVGALFGAASGFATLTNGLCRAYHVRGCRPFWQRQLLSLLATLSVPPLGLALLALELLGRSAAGWVAASFGLGQGLLEVLSLMWWPVLFLLMFLGMSLLYHTLPNTRHPYRRTLPGSAVASIGWVLLTGAFGLYVENFGKFDLLYGSFGAVVVFMLWLYLAGLMVLLGAEVNAHLVPVQRRHWARAWSEAGPAPALKAHRLEPIPD